MADNSNSVFLARAKSAINSLNLVIKRHSNTANEIKSSISVCMTSLMDIISELVSKSNDNLNQKTSDDITTRLDAIEKSNSAIISELKQMKPKTYALAVGETSNLKIIDERLSKTRHLIVIKPKNESSNSKQSEHVIKAMLDKARKSRLVESVKYISKGGLLLDVTTNEDSEDIKQLINSENNDFTAERPKRRNPKLVLYDVDSDLTEENLIENIIESNKDIEDFIYDNNLKTDEEILVKFKFRRTNANSNGSQIDVTKTTNTWVIEVSPEMRRLLVNKRLIKIGWRAIRFADYIPIIRCHKCNGFGHFQKDCRSEMSCGHCAQQHNTRDCKTAKQQHKCTNCMRNNDSHKKSRPLNINHSSFSDNCDVYKKIVNVIKSKFDYV